MRPQEPPVSTTSLIAELLVAGLLALVWVAILVMVVAGAAPLKWFMGAIAKQQGVFIPLFLAFAYVFGVGIDRLSDYMFDVADKSLQLQFHEQNEGRDAVIQVYERADDRTINFLEYLRGRIRVSRSAALNLSLIVVMTIVLARGRNFPGRTFSRVVVIKSVCIVVIPLIALAGFAWYRISRSYYERLKQTYQHLPPPSTNAAVK